MTGKYSGLNVAPKLELEAVLRNSDGWERGVGLYSGRPLFGLYLYTGPYAQYLHSSL
jgi:hypothetical protein